VGLRNLLGYNATSIGK